MSNVPQHMALYIPMPTKGIQVNNIIITPEEVELFNLVSGKLLPAFDLLTLSTEGWQLSAASTETLRDWDPSFSMIQTMVATFEKAVSDSLEEMPPGSIELGPWLQLWMMATLGFMPCPCGCMTKSIPADWEVAYVHAIATLEARRLYEGRRRLEEAMTFSAEAIAEMAEDEEPTAPSTEFVL